MRPAMDSETKHTPGPWDYVPGTEHHGPYVTTEYGSTICDCYTMGRPELPSVLNGGISRPLRFLAEMAEPNARLIAAAPELLTALTLLHAHLFGPEPAEPRHIIDELCRAALSKATQPQDTAP